MRLRQFVVAGAMVMMASACGPEQDGSVPGAGAAVSGSPANARSEAVLTQTYNLIDQSMAATNKVVIKCMEDKGFKKHRMSLTDTSMPSSRPPGYPYGDTPPPVEQAKVDGYGLSGPRSAVTPSGPTKGKDPQADISADERARYSAAYGTPASVTVKGQEFRFYRGGCFEQVVKDLFGTPESYFRFKQWPVSGNNDVTDQWRKRREVTDAWAAWSTCMRTAGLPNLQEPYQAHELAAGYYHPVSNVYNPAEAKSKEVRIATADAECSASTQTPQKMRQAFDTVLATYVTAHETELVGAQDELRKALDKAQTVLGS